MLVCLPRVHKGSQDKLSCGALPKIRVGWAGGGGWGFSRSRFVLVEGSREFCPVNHTCKGKAST